MPRAMPRGVGWVFVYITLILAISILSTVMAANRALAAPLCCYIPPTENCSEGWGKYISPYLCPAGGDWRCPPPVCW